MKMLLLNESTAISKQESSLGKTFQNIHQTHSVVQENITLYNSKRPHSSIGYLTPDKAHAENHSFKNNGRLALKKQSMETTKDKYYSTDKSPPCKVRLGVLTTIYIFLVPLCSKYEVHKVLFLAKVLPENAGRARC